MIVCICNNVSDRKISQAVESGIKTMPQLRAQLGVGTCCGKCHTHAKQVLREQMQKPTQTLCQKIQPLIFHRGPLAV